MLLRDVALAALVPRMHQDRSKAASTVSNFTVGFYGNFGYGGVYDLKVFRPRRLRDLSSQQKTQRPITNQSTTVDPQVSTGLRPVRKIRPLTVTQKSRESRLA